MDLDLISRKLDSADIKYWEFRQDSNESTTAIAWNNQIKRLASSMKLGWSIRLLLGNSWSFVYFEDEKKLDDAIRRAIHSARSLDKYSRSHKELFGSEAVKSDKKTRLKIDPADISLQEKKKLVLGLSKIQCKKTKNNQIIYLDQRKDMTFMNSEGSDIHQRLTYCYCGASVTVQDNGVMESFDVRKGGLTGFELTKSLPEIAISAHKKALSLTKAVVPKGGIYPVVCDPGLTDVFIHEALGHAAEADLVRSKDSCLQGMMGNKIAKNFVNVYDDSTLKGGWGSFFFDDEGIEAQKTQLIKSGRLVSFMHSRETAAEMNVKSTGNARAQSVAYVPQVRMSNTYIEKGQYKRDELFEGIKLGVYLGGSRGGQVDTAKGSFQFSAQEGFMIRNGRLCERLRGVSLAGSTLKTLANIEKVSDRYQEGFPGFCGKGGQSVPVIGNCPHILIRKATVGGK